MSPIITLTTDFGEGSPYVAQMKGVILALNPAANIVDITHGIAPQNIRHGAVVLDEVTRRFPAGTIHVAVVDPGVGTNRQLVYARCGGQVYLAPDNGLLGLVCRIAPDEHFALTNWSLFLPEVSTTFHGRDILAPVAARLSLGLDPCELGPPLAGLISLDWPIVRVEPRRIVGTIVACDSFGNLITDISTEMLAAASGVVRVECGGHEVVGLVKTYAELPAGTPAALFGSSGKLELAIVNGHAARSLGLTVGAEVRASW